MKSSRPSLVAKARGSFEPHSPQYLNFGGESENPHLRHFIFESAHYFEKRFHGVH